MGDDLGIRNLGFFSLNSSWGFQVIPPKLSELSSGQLIKALGSGDVADVMSRRHVIQWPGKYILILAHVFACFC